jgi:2-methylcitrate dehydratase PrpD
MSRQWRAAAWSEPATLLPAALAASAAISTGRVPGPDREARGAPAIASFIVALAATAVGLDVVGR